MAKFFTLLLILWLAAFPAQAAEEGVVVRDSNVYGKASAADKSIGKLKAGTRVSVFSRSGGWKEVFSEQQNLIGWVRSYQVREGLITKESKDQGEADSRGFLAGLAAFSRRATSFFGGGDDSQGTNRTATIGVRGLSEEEIKGAKPDLQELKKMQSFASSQARLKPFVSQGGLTARKVKHLKEKK